jgi:hypothetical protein
MKISKTLLGAILVGVAVQTTASSCTKKDKDAIKPKSEVQANEQAATQNNPDPGSCPACGMG